MSSRNKHRNEPRPFAFPSLLKRRNNFDATALLLPLRSKKVVLIGGAPTIANPPWEPDFHVGCNYWPSTRNFKADVIFTTRPRSENVEADIVVSKDLLLDEEKWFNRSYGLNPTMGFLAIKKLLDIGVDQLFVTGFNFYGYKLDYNPKVHGANVSRHIDILTLIYEEKHRLKIDQNIYRCMVDRLVQRSHELGELWNGQKA